MPHRGAAAHLDETARRGMLEIRRRPPDRLSKGFMVQSSFPCARRSTRPPRPTLRPTSRGKIIGHDPRLREILAVLDRVAATNCTVLVTGESGTGKELIVAALHDRSPRASKPLVAINCGAIPAQLVESELFGAARGAFTGAQQSRQGLIAAAEGSTLFLDEVGELPLAAQVKLLRVLQQREYTPVGDTRVVRCDVRVVAATHRDLEADMKAGRFREDLYYRLNVIHVAVPSLRERPDDIMLLARYFLGVCASRFERDDALDFEPEVDAVLRSHPWRGNVRALENLVERLVLLTRGARIGLGDLPEDLRRPAPAQPPHDTPMPDAGVDLEAAVEAYTSRLITMALERTQGNKNRAAQLLRLNRTTLVEMIKRKGAKTGKSTE